MKWMDIAWAEQGQHEIAGNDDNPRILDYFKSVGHPEVKHDETPWCAAFVGACLEAAGIASTRALNARSYLTYGLPLSAARVGAIAVMPRGIDPLQGHVGFVAGIAADGRIALLGGNQGDAVSIVHYPVEKFIGFRWPPGEGPDPAMQAQTASVNPAAADSASAAAPQTTPLGWVAVVDAFKGSKTVLGGLLAAGGILVQWANDLLSAVCDGLAQAANYAPLQELLLLLGANTKAVGFGLGMFGVALAITRRLDAAAKGKIG